MNPENTKFDKNNEYTREAYFKSQAKELLATVTYKKTPKDHSGTLLKSKREIARLESIKKTNEELLMRAKEKGRKIKKIDDNDDKTSETRKSRRTKGDAFKRIEGPRWRGDKKNAKRRMSYKNDGKKRIKK